MKKMWKLKRIGLYTLLISAMITGSVWALKADQIDPTSCQTKYPIILAHGMGFEPSDTYPNSFPGIVEALQARGAEVYTPTVAALGATRYKAEQFKEEFLKIQAISGAEKFNIMAHSHGCLYTRDAITNLGLAPYVVSHTSAAGVHHGTEIAGMSVKLAEVAPALGDMIMGLLPFGGDPELAEINIEQLTPDYMINVFNPNTPDVEGIYYQSWIGKYRRYPIMKALVGMIQMIASANGDEEGGEMTAESAVAELYDSLPGLATEIYYLGGGENDGLVPVESAKWGNFLGVQTGPWWSPGVNHLDEVNLVPDGNSFDAVSYWVKLVEDLKARGY